jgi:DNA primase
MSAMGVRQYDAEALKQARPLSEVVRESGVELDSRWSGRGTHKALCPFHAEKTPSLLVDDRDGHFHCFGCGAHGDVFDYLQKLYNLTFPQACERLGAAWGDLPVSLLQRREAPPPRRWDRLTLVEQEVMNRAAHLYHRRLRSARRVQAYLRERGVGPELTRECALGYSDGKGLLPALAAAGSEYVEAALSLGLLRDREEGPREFMAGRLVVPEIRGGNCIWMIGRSVVVRPHTPKYLALDGEKPILGWERAAGKREVVLTEGPFDYLAALGAGYAAASLCGTSMAPERLGFLARAERVYVVLDGDDAGREGAEKLRDVLGDRCVRVALPEGSDLGDVARLPGGRGRVRELIGAALGRVA